MTIKNNHWLTNAQASVNLAYKWHDDYANSGPTSAAGYTLDGIPMHRWANNLVGNSTNNDTTWNHGNNVWGYSDMTNGSSYLHLDPSGSDSNGNYYADAWVPLKCYLPAGTKVLLKCQYRLPRVNSSKSPNIAFYFNSDSVGGAHDVTGFPDNSQGDTWKTMETTVTLSGRWNHITVFNHNDDKISNPAILEVANIVVVPIGTYETLSSRQVNFFTPSGQPRTW